MKRIALSMLLFSATPIFAQQPDIRVRLLTLFQLTRASLQPTPGTQVSWSTGAAKHVFNQETSVRYHAGVIEIAGHSAPKFIIDGDFRINTGLGPLRHRQGKVEISCHDNSLLFIAIMPVEEYVANVLQGETAGTMPEEALKAMSVAIRSYTTRFRERHKEDGFDFCDTTHCQFLRLEPQPTVVAAVKQTSGLLLWDRGTPLAAFYHKDCGGRSEDVKAIWGDQSSPSLISHPDGYCVRTEHGWRAEISRADLDRVIHSAGLQVPPDWDRIAVAERTGSGRAHTLRFSRGRWESGALVSASTLRFAIGRSLGWATLKSDWYEVLSQGDHFIFVGKGVGHGVGLCQTGMMEMAREGKTYRDILAFYYPGAEIGKSAKGIQWTAVPTESFELRVVNASDRIVSRTAARSALQWATQRSGLALHSLPLIEVYPTVAMFRDATGEPGWVAASTHNQHVRIEPPSVLRDKFESVLRHEFLHMLVEDNTAPGTPLWFREGLVVFLGGDPVPAKDVTMSGREIEQAITSRSSDAEMRAAYAQAAAMVRDMDREGGRSKLLDWLRNGLPQNVRGGDALSAPNKETR